MSRIELLIGQLQTARGYTAGLVDSIAGDDWFRQPSEGVTHVAWQVGHIAAAEYFLTMNRIRGARESDADVIPPSFLKAFGKGSTVQSDPDVYPAVDEIRQVFDRVHRQAIEELSETADAVLDEPVDPPHPMFSTKLGALTFAPMHEMVHAGQIGLIRRLLGNEPLR